MTAKDIGPLTVFERGMLDKAKTAEEGVAAILARRQYLRDYKETLGELMREQYRGRYYPRSKKETATMPILYDEDE